MNTCKHFDIDNCGNRICRLGGLCENPETCKNKTKTGDHSGEGENPEG